MAISICKHWTSTLGRENDVDAEGMQRLRHFISWPLDVPIQGTNIPAKTKDYVLGDV